MNKVLEQNDRHQRQPPKGGSLLRWLVPLLVQSGAEGWGAEWGSTEAQSMCVTARGLAWSAGKSL